MIRLSVRWGGHHLDLSSIYAPPSNHGEDSQLNFLQNHLSPSLSSSSMPQIVGGDWNFTPDWQLDRTYSETTQRHVEERVANKMKRISTTHSLIDIFRHRHPSRWGYTYHHTRAASRIDRIYVSDTLLPYVRRIDLMPCTISDHLPCTHHSLPSSNFSSI